MDKFLFGETPAFDLDLEGRQLQSPHEVTFGGEDMLGGLSMDEALIDNDQPDFAESSLDLGIMDTEEMYADPQESLTLGKVEALDAMVRHLSANPSVVVALNRGITAGKLDMIGSAINADLLGMYDQDEDVNTMVNAIAQGIVVSNKFEKAVPHTVKMYYVPKTDEDSIHLGSIAGTGLKRFKATPAITAFNKESLDAMTAIYKAQTRGFNSLSSYMKDACYRPLAKKADDSSKAYHAFDNMTLAKNLAKSKMSVEKGMSRLAGIGFDKARCDKIAVLAKAIKDNK